MSPDIKANNSESPATIYRKLIHYMEEKIESVKERDNVDIIIDIHWFFIHSKYHKRNFNYKKHIGKWKYYATSYTDFYDKVF
ncbi:hypothetical protein ACFL9U_06680, partial [Thermodesulfobacteriota bacterium]